MIPTLPAASQPLNGLQPLGGGDVNAGCTDACTSAVDDDHCPGFEGRDTRPVH